jgi:Carboxypeptidase regulatory-like domain
VTERRGVAILLVLGAIAGLVAVLAGRDDPGPDESRDRGAIEVSLPDRFTEESPVAGRATLRGRIVRFGASTPVSGAKIVVGAAEAISGEDGRFLLESLDSGPASLSVEAVGFEDLRIEATVPPSGADVGDLVMCSPTRLHGKVVDEMGLSVPDARVCVLEMSRHRTSNRWSGPHRDQLLLAIRTLQDGEPLPGFVVVTAADGTFSIAGLSPGAYDVSARLTGKRTARGPIVLVKEGEESSVRLVLCPGAAIVGHVHDPAGEPVARARILAAPMSELHRLPYARVETAITGADGSFRVGGLLAGKPHVLLVMGPGGRMGHALSCSPPAQDVRITVLPRVTLAGTVRDDETGEPLANVELVGLLGRAVSGEDGRYELPGIRAHPILGMVRLTKDGYDPSLERLVFAIASPGGTVSRDFRLSRTILGRLRVTVRDPSGAPLEGVTIEILDLRSRTSRARGVTSSLGEAVLEGLPVGGGMFSTVGHELRVSHPGFVVVQRSRSGEREAVPLETRTVVVPPKGEGSAEVVLAPVGSVSGRVRDPSGRPVADVIVAFGETTTRSRPDGGFELTGLPRDHEIPISFRMKGFVDLDLTMVPGGAPIDVTLQPGGALVGRVHDEAGRPIEGAMLRVTAADADNDFVDSTWSAADGGFRISGLPPGPYDVAVGNDGHVPQEFPTVEVRAGDDGKRLDIRLAAGIEIEILPVHPGGALAVGVVLLRGPLALPVGDRVQQAGVRYWGRDRIKPARAVLHVVPGRYWILVYPLETVEDCGAVETTIDLLSAGTFRIKLGTRASRIVVRPKLPSGCRIQFIAATRTTPLPAFRVGLYQASDGLHVSPPLPPGTYALDVTMDAGTNAGPVKHRFEGLEPGGDPIEVDLTGPR